jgi:hypothetical protein
MSWSADQAQDRAIQARWHAEHVLPCMRDHRDAWWVYQRNGNTSAFSGGHWTPSDYSGIRCEACGRRWRTKAAYVTALPDKAPRWGVFVRQDGGGEWREWHRWTYAGLAQLIGQQAAEHRAAEIHGRHPEWQVEVRPVRDPLPGTFEETFAAFLPEQGTSGQETRP